MISITCENECFFCLIKSRKNNQPATAPTKYKINAHELIWFCMTTYPYFATLAVQV